MTSTKPTRKIMEITSLHNSNNDFVKYLQIVCKNLIVKLLYKIIVYKIIMILHNRFFESIDFIKSARGLYKIAILQKHVEFADSWVQTTDASHTPSINDLLWALVKLIRR